MSADVPTPPLALYSDATHDVAMILAFLHALPSTPEGIAAYLHERGVKGTPCASHACALAVWLQRETYGAVDVSQSRVEVTAREWSFTCHLPSHVSDFVVGFDEGCFPMLFVEPTP